MKIDIDNDLKAFVIGSLSQEEKIREYGEKLASKIGNENVRYVKSEPDKDFDHQIGRASCRERV